MYKFVYRMRDKSFYEGYVKGDSIEAAEANLLNLRIQRSHLNFKHAIITEL